MKEDPEQLMPMEKAEKYGIKSLSPSELLAVILRTGQPGLPVTKLTADLMARNDNRLKVLERRTREELMLLPGIGRVKAFQIEAVLEIMRRYNLEKIGDRPKIRSSKDIFNYMQPELADKNTEHIWLIILNRACAVIERKLMSSGGMTATVFDIKMVMRHLILVPGIEGVIMVHNHPSGNLRPSREDDNITRSLKQACAFFSIKVMDHVIVTQDGHYSYADEGRLEAL